MQLTQYLNEKQYKNIEGMDINLYYGLIRINIIENDKNYQEHIIFNTKTFEITYIISDISCMYSSKSIDLFEIEKDELWGVTDAFGNEVLPCKYSYLDINPGIEKDDGDTVIIAGTPDKKCTLYNKKGETISNTYDFIEKTRCNEMFLLKNNNKEGAINRLGQVVVEPKYKAIYFDNLSEKLVKHFIVGYEYSKLGVIDLKGNELIPLKYHSITYLGKDTFFLESNDHKYDIVKL